MTAMTDDIGPRLAAVETDIRNINAQLERVNTELQESRREQASGRKPGHAR